MYVVVANLGESGGTTDWEAFGPYLSEQSADDVFNEINGAAGDGRISLDRVIVIPLNVGVTHQPDLIVSLLQLRQAGE